MPSPRAADDASAPPPGSRQPPGGAEPPAPAPAAPPDAPAPAAPPDAPPPAAPPASGALARLVAVWPWLDPYLFAAYAGACVLYAALAFYGSMHQQTGGVWSAPLDDVFIHFDYARATARGYPFQWSEGNGFSSGNTSLTYPFVLALGYLVGFRGLLLMQWAALVACVCTLAFLLVGGRLLEPLGRWAKYLLPPVALSVGALDWSLFSGMENAFHLGVWALCATPILDLAAVAAPSPPPAAAPDEALEPPPFLAPSRAQRVARLGWLSGLAGALLFATRPESVVCVAALGLFAALAVRRALGGRAALATILRIAVPGVVAFAAQAVANRAFTGEWAANGAIAKLALNNPYMTAGEKWDTYEFLAGYVVLRNTQHHFADALPWGWLVPALAAVPLASRSTRAIAVTLWAQVLGWLALVALNGQVRWQNERYTMPAVAWLLVLAAMGLALLVRRPAPVPGEPRSVRPPRALWLGRVALACALAALFWRHQLPRMRDQIWFFGRASRNIRDQHLVAGKILAELGVARVLVGDAGALLYAADRPGLDLIGLGGYHDLPFARAGVHGLGASIELIERIPPVQRPDSMALYPSWWGDLPTVFGRRLVSVPVVGNVICGGAEKVIYRADWSPLERHAIPADLRADERVVDEVDVADLVSERAHDYTFPRPQMGFVGYHVLPNPRDPKRDLFDAGRLVPRGQRETARVRAPRGPARLVARTVAPRDLVVEIAADGRALGRLAFRGRTGWSEASLDLPAGLPEPFTLTLTPLDADWSNHHVWIVEHGPVQAGSSFAGQ